MFYSASNSNILAKAIQYSNFICKFSDYKLAIGINDIENETKIFFFGSFQEELRSKIQLNVSLKIPHQLETELEKLTEIHPAICLE